VSGRAQARLVAEILFAYLGTRWQLRRRPLPEVVARLRIMEVRAPTPLAAYQGARLGRAVGRTLELLPSDSRCLVRSLVLMRLLARRGVNAALVIAARPGSRGDDLDAHAWVEVAGQAVLPPAGSDYGRLVLL
jgi:hypothetical protein